MADDITEAGLVTTEHPKHSRDDVLQFLERGGIKLELAPKTNVILFHTPDDNRLKELVGTERFDLAKPKIDFLLTYITADAFFDNLKSHDERRALLNPLEADSEYGGDITKLVSNNQTRVNNINDVQAYMDYLERLIDKNPKLDPTVKTPILNTLYKVRWFIKDNIYHPKGDSSISYDKLTPEEKMQVVGKVIGGIDEVFVTMFPTSPLKVIEVTGYTRVNPIDLPYERVPSVA